MNEGKMSCYSLLLISLMLVVLNRIGCFKITGVILWIYDLEIKMHLS